MEIQIKKRFDCEKFQQYAFSFYLDRYHPRGSLILHELRHFFFLQGVQLGVLLGRGLTLLGSSLLELLLLLALVRLEEHSGDPIVLESLEENNLFPGPLSSHSVGLRVPSLHPTKLGVLQSTSLFALLAFD